MNMPATGLIPVFGEQLLARADEILEYHQAQTGEITVRYVDELIEDATELMLAVSNLLKVKKEINKRIMRLQSKAGNSLKSLGRDYYESPTGEIEIVQKWSVRMPKDDEDKALLFEHLRERKIFDRYATVNSRSLNSLHQKDWEAAVKKDPDNWMLFRMPGVGETVLDEHTKIKPMKGITLEKDEDEDDEVS